jgi:hypothetical protein
MSELVETTTHSFHSKDGMYYASYNEMVAANIKANEAFMVEKGLDSASMQRMKKQQQYTNSPKKRPAPLAVANDDRAPRRRSTRTRTPRVVSDSNNGSSSSTSSSALVDSGNIDDIDQILERQEKQRQAKQQKQAARSKKVAIASTSVRQLSEADRSKLQNLPEWVESMATYLITEEHLSIPNQRSVMRQVEKLAAGVGVEYKRWGSNVFMQGTTVDLSMDFDDIHEQAKDFEVKHGKDLGNGWAIRHPIKKLANFQRYCLEEEKA